MSRRVLFVCTGNICRSPLAEYVARAIFSGRNIVFESAGTFAPPGSPATDTMISVGDEMDLDLRLHQSRSLDSVDQPDLVLCMEDSHVNAAMARFPEMEPDAIRLLGRQPIVDPYGQTTERYRTCAADIATAIETLDL